MRMRDYNQKSEFKPQSEIEIKMEIRIQESESEIKSRHQKLASEGDLFVSKIKPCMYAFI